mmetsp:Transcript_12556/g.20917  ORF Transcript_12556/g.20917 Transcript_12556/m.20917 type:complete len:813 (-) Transcript_12556:59-2497(-)
MENMNLASRCREAISHVSMLKKELAMHQRRAAEALAMQRQQHVVQQQQQVQRAAAPETPKAITVLAAPRSNTNGGVSKTDVAAEMDRMDRLMAAHAPPPPPPIPAAPKDVSDDASPNGELFSDYNEEKKTPSEEDMVGVSFNTKPIFPHSASPRVTDRSNDYNEGFPNDLPPSSTRKKKLLSSIFREESPAEISEVESEAGSVNGSVVSGVSVAENRKSILSSLDAFEASFATDFPHSFSGSPKEEEELVYNPFLPSPARKDVEQPELSEEETTKARSGPPPPQLLPPRSSPDKDLSKMVPPRFSSPRAMPMEMNRNNSAAIPSTPSRSLREVTPPAGDTPQTPTKHSISPDNPSTPTSSIAHIMVPTDDSEQPRRPEKTASASARARYEKALQPRVRPNSLRKVDNDDSDQQDSEPEPLVPEPLVPEPLPEPESPTLRRTTVDIPRSRFRTQPSSPTAAPSAPSRSKSPSMVLKRLQERKLTSSPRASSKTAIPTKPESPLIPITSQKLPSPRSARKTVAANSQKLTSPVPSRTASPFPRTQPSPTLLPIATPAAAPAPPQGSDLPAESPAKKANTVSPSVSSAISAYERAAKRKDTITASPAGRTDAPPRTSARPSYRSSFTPKTARAASPKPFDEGDSMPTPPSSATRGSATRSVSAREYQLDYGRRMSEEERSPWNGSRPASERELQLLAKRASGIRQDDSPPSSNENLHNSFPSRSNRVVASPEEYGPTSRSHRVVASPEEYGPTNTTPSKFAASGRSTRRTVKQPVSYAEPSLNSKMRRGDTYFAKDQDDTRKNGENGYHAASVRL